MLSLIQAFLASPELQAAATGAVVWAIIAALKRCGVLAPSGSALYRRIGAAAAAALLLAARAYVDWQANAVEPDIGSLVAAVLVAWITATGAYHLTQRREPQP